MRTRKAALIEQQLRINALCDTLPAHWIGQPLERGPYDKDVRAAYIEGICWHAPYYWYKYVTWKN